MNYFLWVASEEAGVCNSILGHSEEDQRYCDFKKLGFLGFTYMWGKKGQVWGKAVFCLFVFHLEHRFVYLKCQNLQLAELREFKLEFLPPFLVLKCK